MQAHHGVRAGDRRLKMCVRVVLGSIRLPGVRACKKSSICSVAGSTGSSRLCHAYGRTSGISASTDDVRTPMLGQKMTTWRSSSTAAQQRHTLSACLPCTAMHMLACNTHQALAARTRESRFGGSHLLSDDARSCIVCDQRPAQAITAEDDDGAQPRFDWGLDAH